MRNDLKYTLIVVAWVLAIGFLWAITHNGNASPAEQPKTDTILLPPGEKFVTASYRGYNILGIVTVHGPEWEYPKRYTLTQWAYGKPINTTIIIQEQPEVHKCE